MNREQAREIAEDAFDRWQGVHDVPLQVKVADALHAAYEAERAACPMELHFVCDGPPSHESGRFVELEDGHGRGLGIGDWRKRDDGLWALVVPYGVRESASVDARLASIKETARRIWAAWNGVWESKDEPTILSESEFKFRSDGAVNMAEMLESAFERRYGAGGGNGNSGIWVKPGDLLDAAIKPQHGGKP